MHDRTRDEDAVELAEWLAVAVRAAQAPAQMIVEYFEQGRAWKERKSDGSPVTIADREAERLVREILSTASPRPCDILGEEQGLSGPGTRWRWAVDPIDGTRSFVRGIPLFGTIVALEDTATRQALVGVIHFPILRTTYAGARGSGSTCDGRSLTVSSVKDPRDAMIAVGDPLQFSAAGCDGAHRYLYEEFPCVRGYTDCFGHALVASGCVDVMLDPSLNPWDILATQVLVEEAGGQVLLRPSTLPGKVDALFGNPALVSRVAHTLGF